MMGPPNKKIFTSAGAVNGAGYADLAFRRLDTIRRLAKSRNGKEVPLLAVTKILGGGKYLALMHSGGEDIPGKTILHGFGPEPVVCNADVTLPAFTVTATQDVCDGNVDQYMAMYDGEGESINPPAWDMAAAFNSQYVSMFNTTMSSNNYSYTVWEYDLVKETITTHTAGIQGGIGPALCHRKTPDGSYVYVFGGVYYDSNDASESYFMHTLGTVNWVSGSQSIPEQRAFSKSAAVGDYAYVVGGQPESSVTPGTIDGASSNRVFQFAFDGATWAEVAPMNSARSYHSMTVFGDKIYVFGGRTSSTSGNQLSSAEVYDPALGSWSLIAGMPKALSHHVCGISTDGNIYIMGGFDSTGANLKTYAYNIETNQYFLRSDMPVVQDQWGGTESGLGFGIAEMSACLYLPFRYYDDPSGFYYQGLYRYKTAG